jgi:hypothetical protein
MGRIAAKNKLQHPMQRKNCQGILSHIGGIWRKIFSRARMLEWAAPVSHMR